MKDSNSREQNSHTNPRYGYSSALDASNDTVQKKDNSQASSAFPVKQFKPQDTTKDIALKNDPISRFHALKDQEASSQKNNQTGLPDNLKSGIENLSGYSMDDVKVHYNSDKPASLQAHAYAQGTDIHVASGQEKHLPHEAWHVVQQKQGRVQATMQMKSGTEINDDTGLEKEADVMGQQVLTGSITNAPAQLKTNSISNEIIQGKIKAKNFRKLIEDQNELQDKVKANPEDYKGEYTTVGFEHEFAQMKDGDLQGVSHLEVAKSEEKMPLTNLPFILETDAQNALELVTPPFLIETIKGKPIPEPDDIEAVDDIIKTSLRRKTDNDANLTISSLIAKFSNKNGLNFPLNKVQIKRENITPKTKDEIYDKGIGRNHTTVSQTALSKIALEPSTKGGGGEKHISTHVNFATDADTYDKIQDLYGKNQRNDDSARGYLELQNGFKEVLFREFFKSETKKVQKDKKRSKLLKKLKTIHKEIKVQLTQLNVLFESEADKHFSSFKRFNFRSISEYQQDAKNNYEKAESKLQSLSLTPAGIILCLNEFEESIIAIRNTIKARFSNYDNTKTTQKVKEEDFLGMEGEMNTIKALVPEVTTIKGVDNPNLKIFINSLARTLSGLYAVPAMDEVRKAQKKRLSDPDKKMHVGNETTKLSIVKDINQVWIKDTIVNIGLGILQPADWQKVYEMTENTNLLDSLKQIDSPNLHEYDDDKKDKFHKLLEGSFKTLRNNIKDHKLNKTGKDGNPKTDTSQLSLSPKEQPKLFSHKSKHINPRQDTFIPGKKVQMPVIWEGKRLHVVESRKNTVEVLRELKELHANENTSDENSTDTKKSMQEEDYIIDEDFTTKKSLKETDYIMDEDSKDTKKSLKNDDYTMTYDNDDNSFTKKKKKKKL